jgi:hypothetical protein
MLEQSGSSEPMDPARWGDTREGFLRRIHDAQQRLSEIEDRLHEQIRRELRPGPTEG